MQKIKWFFTRLKYNPYIQRALSSLEKARTALKIERMNLGILVFYTIIIFASQIIFHLQKANGTLLPSSSFFWQLFSWMMTGYTGFMLYLGFRHETRIPNRFTLTESIFTAIAIAGIVLLSGVGIGKLTWLLAGGIQTEKDLVTVGSLCSTPTSIKSTNSCKNCAGNLILYNTRIKNLEKVNEDYNLQTVNHLDQAEYIACIDSTTHVEEICKYEKGDEYTMSYETVTVRVFSLLTGKQQGTDSYLAAAAPGCPFFVTTTNGVSDFPYLTEVEKDSIYQAIENKLK